MRVDVSKVDNIIALMCVFETKGAFTQQHIHTFDHAHLVGAGVVRVCVAGSEDELFKAGDMINIKAGLSHKLIAETDDAVSFCIHALKEGDDGKTVDFGNVVL